jgi:ABC-type nickel/cobalt efflux system permease component RcnA
MRRILTLLSLSGFIGLFAFWWTGGFDQLAFWAAGQQRAFQNSMALSLRSARAGEAGATAALLMGCFAYGLAHAAGPGHGKILIGGYGVARAVPMKRLSLIALAASLGQAITAIVLVYTGVLVLNLGREFMVGTTEAVMAPISYGAIAVIGGWLVLRGARRMRTTVHDHDHQGDEATCSSCGHAHGPTLDEVDNAGTLREAFALIAGIAVRPCTGALFVLIITWQMGIGLLGIVGAFAMALGTGAVTVAVGLAAGGLRTGLLSGLMSSPKFAQIAAFVEVLAGVVIAILAGGLLIRAL